MEWRAFNRTTSEVASNTDLRGRATAEEANQGRQVGRGSLRRIAGLTVLKPLMAAGLLIEFTPAPAWAEEHERGIHRQIDALEAKVASLEQMVSALQGQIGSLQTSNTTLQGKVNSLQTELAVVQSNRALMLGPFVSVNADPEIGVRGPNITFSGANIHIVSGSGATDDHRTSTGLGNLIIGYNEDPNVSLTGDLSDGLPIMQAPGFPTPLNPGDRGGAHNLVIGGGNRFTQTAFGGIVAGERNTINGFGVSVSGGFNNTASGLFASVSGGVRNNAGSQFGSISGGGLNTVGPSSGGSVTGGFSNTADTPFSIVIGGYGNTSGGMISIAPQPPFP
jgi:hypothetical protein